MIDFAFQAGKALLNHERLWNGDRNLRWPMHQKMPDQRWEQSGKVDVIPFMINHLNSGARRKADLVA